MKDLISIIVPVYNGELYIKDCLDSILEQTYKNIEIIVINDGSTDNTAEILNSYSDKYHQIRVINQENKGQGFARNLALKKAKGKYISFIDADDFVDKDFICYLYASVEKNNSDFAICDWKYFSNGIVNYVSSEKLMGNRILEGKEIEELLNFRVYFTVNKLYKKDFLLKHDILYGEGYIYEDFEFFVKTAVFANKVSLVSNPFYNVRVNKKSTTKTNYNTLKHYNSYLQAIESSYSNLSYRNKYTPFYITNYFLNRMHLYSRRRIPKNKKKDFIIDTCKVINNANLNFYFPNQISRYRKYEIENLVPNYSYNKMIVGNIIQKSLLRIKPKVKRVWSILKRYKFKSIKLIYYKFQLLLPLSKKSILFLGFDHKYVGNSKYFFNEIKDDEKYEVKFASNDRKDSKHFVNPNSFKFYKYLARSKYIVLETWAPLSYKKRKNTKWIQLWHGTPMKKMLFDSHESVFVKNVSNFKKNKFMDIKRWDYFVCENEFAKQIFKRAFLIPEEKIILNKYPRVKYLLEEKENANLKTEIKKELNIPLDKKIIFYAPTWRDYNHGAKNKNLKYLLNLNKLVDKLSDDYFIIYSEHSFSSDNIGIKKTLNVRKYDTQKMLLITDHLITDYSSILFDYLYLDKPFSLFINDCSEYQKVRGIYDIIIEDFEVNIFKQLDDLVGNIKKPQKIKRSISANYINNNSECNLIKTINEGGL